MFVLCLVFALLFCSCFEEATPFAIGRSRTLCRSEKDASFVWSSILGRTLSCCDGAAVVQKGGSAAGALRRRVFSEDVVRHPQRRQRLSPLSAFSSSSSSGEAFRAPLRNVAIVAHVDHGKTTTVDALLEFASQFGEGAAKKPTQERAMDREELERERGITIKAKVASLLVPFGDGGAASAVSGLGRINLIDTPGHADFGGEVERVLHMADGVLLLVDAVEGPKPQTRAVLQKALQFGLPAVLGVNKVDRENASPEEAAAKVFDLFVQLDASEEQANFEVVYLSAMLRKSGFSPTKLESSMAPLVSALWKLPPPKAAPAEAPLQLQVAHIDEDPYKGRLVLGKLQAGVLTPQRTVGIASVALQSDGTSSLSVRKGPSSLSLIPSLSQGLPAVVQSQEASASASGDAFAFPANFNALLRYEGMELRPLELPDLSSAPEFGSASSSLQGDIVVLSGLSEEVRVGDTVVDLQNPVPLPSIEATPPSVSVTLFPNSSPLAGRDATQGGAKAPGVGQLHERLKRLVRNDISVTVEHIGSAVRVSGRGALQLTVLIENLRRAGIELAVAAPDILPKWDGEQWLEPYEDVEITLPEEAVGGAIQEVQRRHSSVKDMRPTESGSDAATSISFRIATRFSFGLRNAVGALSKGTALFQATPAGYHPLVEGAPQPSALSQQAETRRQRRLPQEGEKDPHSSVLVKMKKRIEGEKGSNSLGFLVATEAGLSTGRGISHAQELGSVFIGVGEEVYPGMIVGLNNKPSNLPINVCKAKKLTNVRSAVKETMEHLEPPVPLTLDGAMEMIGREEVIEVTPTKIRLALRSAMK